MGVIEKIKNYIRVLKLVKRPTREDFIDALRICSIGMLLIGIIGFILYLITVLLPIFS